MWYELNTISQKRTRFFFEGHLALLYMNCSAKANDLYVLGSGINLPARPALRAAWHSLSLEEGVGSDGLC